MTRETALGVVALRWLVCRGGGRERAVYRVIFDRGPSPTAAVRKPLAVFLHEVDPFDRRLSNLLLRGRNAYSLWVNEINGANLTGQLDRLGPSFLLRFSEERQQELIR